MRITADVIDIDDDTASECFASNKVQAQASHGAISKHSDKMKLNAKVPASREQRRKKFDEKCRKMKETEVISIKIDEYSEDNEEKDEDEFTTGDSQSENLESQWSPFLPAKKSVTKPEKMKSKELEQLLRRNMMIENHSRLEGYLRKSQNAEQTFFQKLNERNGKGADRSENTKKKQWKLLQGSEEVKDTDPKIAAYGDNVKNKQKKSQKEFRETVQEKWKTAANCIRALVGCETSPDKLATYAEYLKAISEDESDGYADSGLSKCDKFSEESGRHMLNLYVEQDKTAKKHSKYKLFPDTSDSETEEEIWPPELLVKIRQVERGPKIESVIQNKEKTGEPHFLHPMPKEHTCQAFKRRESVNEKKEKTDEQYMASPMKRRKPGGLLKHSMKRRYERQRNHDLCMHRLNVARSHESPFHCRYQAMKMREMCKKFSDLSITESALKENLRKSFDCMYMHYMVKNKMEEFKANNPKAKMNEETPPQWMVEFLLKMKQEIKDEIMEELSNLPRIEMQGHSASGGKGDENQYHGDVIHPGIFCDNCDQLIHGIRYKCGNCTDFDLCQECESLPNIHNKNHIFLKIRYPVALKLYQKQKWQPFVLPNTGELFPTSFKSHQPKKLYEAKFVQDETVPDGTVLSPSTTFMKSWRVLNSGKRVWTHSTKLQHIQGSAGLTPASEQVDVPHLRPGEEGIVSVLFTTPSVPGVYRSHWNFCHKSRPFGHIVWCHIVVKDSEPEEKIPESTGETIQLPNEKEQEVASIAEVLTAVKEEHERGNMIPRKLAVKSHTATPNNTPFDLTPPKSPDHQGMSELKEIAEDKESVNSKQNNIDFDPEDEVSVVSLSSSESDTEFVVIPMPKCFNLSESFSSQNSISMSQFVQANGGGDYIELKSEHKRVKPRRIFSKRASNTETVSQETGVPELSAHSEGKKDPEDKILISHNVSADGSSSEISIIESGESSPMEENVTPKISSIHIAVTSDMNLNTDVNCTVTDEKGNVQQVEEREREEPTTDIPTSATFPKFPVEGITSIYESSSSNTTEERTVQVLPERLVTAPLNAAATIYKTARDVISSFQHQGNAHARNNRNVETSGTARSTQLNPMEQLIEMGFCNRQKNEELLKKHKNDVALVVAELVSLNDNDWYAYRHVPATSPTYFD